MKSYIELLLTWTSVMLSAYLAGSAVAAGFWPMSIILLAFALYGCYRIVNSC